jgi:hypothetical protein
VHATRLADIILLTYSFSNIIDKESKLLKLFVSVLLFLRLFNDTVPPAVVTKLDAKMSLCLLKHHAMKISGGGGNEV